MMHANEPDDSTRQSEAVSPPDSREPPLRERVYTYLKLKLNDGALKPGAFLDLNALGVELGLSRTPLRDALLRLEAEGFVTIHPRRGVVLNPLDLQSIRNSYQLLGAIEAVAIIEVAPTFAPSDVEKMFGLNSQMREALDRNDFDDYYSANLAFHDSYIARSSNVELKRLARILKDRLYDFPRRESYLSQWERESLKEHEKLATLLMAGSFEEAAAYVRDVHWSFKVQERYIMAYYFAREAALGPML
ncbi:MAG TPA: GntR family transcriptional regulator [Spirochaetales bacterium]|nr:GntR family transcriptional regulator [Spirochaetales bacterium]HPB66921.1 GntR family transcriptional regulator [Spirochaetales bacterium]HPG85242.1 GntR family transcriptional regulator [Spirochaetales bacterium]